MTMRCRFIPDGNCDTFLSDDRGRTGQWTIWLQLQADLEQLSMIMLDSSEIEVKVVLNLNALLVMQWEEDLIEEIQTREPDQKKLEELPGIVCYVVQPRDTLWDIAKMFYTTMEAIRKLNDLGEGEVKPRQTLLVVKNSGCN